MDKKLIGIEWWTNPLSWSSMWLHAIFRASVETWLHLWKPSLMLCCTSCFEAHLTQSHYIKPKFLLPVHSNIVCCCCFFAYFYSAHFSQSSTSLLAHITPQSKNFSTSHHLTSTTIAINTDSYSQLGDKWKQFHILIFNPFFSMISFANVLCSLSLCPPFSCTL